MQSISRRTSKGKDINVQAIDHQIEYSKLEEEVEGEVAVEEIWFPRGYMASKDRGVS